MTVASFAPANAGSTSFGAANAAAEWIPGVEPLPTRPHTRAFPPIVSSVTGQASGAAVIGEGVPGSGAAAKPARWLPDDPTSTLAFGIASAKDVIEAQNAANARRDAAVRRAGVAALTPRIAWREAAEALTGIPADLYAGKSVREAFVTGGVGDHGVGSRLRGVGVLLVAFALLGLAVVA